MANTKHYYLPYIRRGLGAHLKANASDEQRITKTVQVSVQGGEAIQNATVQVGLYGPGDVLGFRTSIVNRVHPKNNVGNFPPHLIPFIQFGESDFLWRYSSRKDEGGTYWIPWLALIVLKNKDGQEDGEFTEVPHTDPELPRQIELSGEAELPDLKQTWRWAHVHTIGRAGLTKADFGQMIQNGDRRLNARLLCPRKLITKTKYTAFVVPTYRLGSQAAMGNSLTANRTELLWETPETGRGQIIPYYYKWEFRTGQRGDFEYLIKQLEFRTIEDGGGQAIDCSNPGYGLLNAEHTSIPFEGALATAGHQYVDFQAVGGQAETQSDLAEILNRRVEEDEIRRVVPPVYGKWHFSRRLDVLKLDSNRRNWINQLNLDPRYRYVAGLGAQYVKEKQEELMQSAWEQLREYKKANRAANIAKFGREVSSCMHKRIGKTSNEEVLLLSTPIRSKVTVQDSSETASNLHQQMETQSAKWRNLRQSKVRKYMGKKTTRSKFYTKQKDRPNENRRRYRRRRMGLPVLEQAKVQSIKANVLESTDPKNTIEKPFCRRIEAFRLRERKSNGQQVIKKDELRPVMWYPQYHVPTYRYLKEKSPNLLFPGLENIPQNTVSLLQSNPRFIEAYLVGINHEMAAELRWREFPTNMAGSYFRKFWDTTVYSLDDDEKEAFRTGKESAAEYHDALLVEVKLYGYESILDVEEDIFNTTAENMTDKIRTVAKLYEAAVEKWLLTREEDKDIEPLNSWKKGSTLGDHIQMPKEGHADDTEDNQPVILIRGDILNQFPNMRIYLAEKIDGANGQKIPDYTPANREFPVFEGNIDPDIVFLGFGIDFDLSSDYFLVFEEPLAELQYGLDLSKGSDAVSDTSWEHFTDTPAEGFLQNEPSNITDGRWNNPAFIAQTFTQKSVRIAIPLDRFITPKND